MRVHAADLSLPDVDRSSAQRSPVGFIDLNIMIGKITESIILIGKNEPKWDIASFARSGENIFSPVGLIQLLCVIDKQPGLKAFMPERTQTSAIYEQIRGDIIDGNLSAGTKLKTRYLASRFDVGLSPIREALSRLSSEGLVVQSDRRGFTVAAATIDELWNLHHARCMLNEMGLRESIEYGDEAWEDSVLLSSIRMSRLQRPEASTAKADMDRWNAQHRTFHTSLIKACRSQRVVQYCEQLFDEIERYRRIGLNHGAERGAVADEHRQIAEAAVARDTALAVRLLNEHFTRTVEQVYQVLRHQVAVNEA